MGHGWLTPPGELTPLLVREGLFELVDGPFDAYTCEIRAAVPLLTGRVLGGPEQTITGIFRESGGGARARLILHPSEVELPLIDRPSGLVDTFARAVMYGGRQHKFADEAELRSGLDDMVRRAEAARRRSRAEAVRLEDSPDAGDRVRHGGELWWQARLSLLLRLWTQAADQLEEGIEILSACGTELDASARQSATVLRTALPLIPTPAAARAARALSAFLRTGHMPR